MNNHFIPGQLRTVLKDLGIMLHVPGIMAILSLPIAWWFQEAFAYWPFVITAVVSFGTGQLLRWLCRDADEARMPHSMAIAALAWGGISLIGAIPFLLIAGSLAQFDTTPVTILNFQNPWNAVFEAISGFTSAGLTMALRPSELPHSLQWWRTFMQWVGGVGVIVLAISIIEPSEDSYRLYYAEGREKKIQPSLTATVRTIWWIYGLYSVVIVVALWLAGMTFWTALNYGLAAIATGGFGITDNSAGDFGPLIQFIIMIGMILGSISFAVHYKLLRKGNLLAFWSNAQHRALWIGLALVTVTVALANLDWFGQPQWFNALFQAASALGTAGFSSVSLSEWSPTSLFLITIAMIIGGAAGSTAGGIKLERAVLLLHGLLWRFRRIIRKPHEMIRYRYDGENLTEQEAVSRLETAGILVALWTVTLSIGTLLLLQTVPKEYSLTQVIFETASALSAVGLSAGITGPNLDWSAKLVLILLMWMGRLEILPVLILIMWPALRLRNIVRALGR